MKAEIRVEDLRSEATSHGCRYSCRVKGLGDEKELFFLVESDEGHRPVENADWAVLGLLLPAMRSGRSLVIEGSVSPLLLHSLSHDGQLLLQNFDPSLQKIVIQAETRLVTERNNSANLRVGTGFSAGVDSFATVQSYGPESRLPITDIFTFNVGAIGGGRGNNTMRAFGLITDRAREFAELSGLHVHMVDSNVQVFYTGENGLEFPKTHSLRNAAAASLFAGQLDVYLYSSTFSYRELNLTAAYDLAHIEPLLLPLLSTEKLCFVSACAGIDRVEKTRLITQNATAQHMLDVCVSPTAKRAEAIKNRLNCSECWKCHRTMLTLDAIGSLDKFSSVFDLSRYRQNETEIAERIKRRGEKGSAADRSAYEAYAAAKGVPA